MSKKTSSKNTDELTEDLDSFLNPKEPSPKLSNNQMDLLEKFLDANEKTMHLEVLDGFLCALITGPDTVNPDEYLPCIFGGKMPVFQSEEQSNEILGALSQHWEHIHSLVKDGNSYYPFLYADPDGKCSGNEWAYGFILGMDIRRDSWMPLVEESKQEGLLTPILMLYAENMPNISPGEIPAEKREEFITEIVTNLPKIYEHFEADRKKKGKSASIH